MLLWQKPYFCWEHSIIYYHLVLSFLDYAFIFSGVTFCRSPDDFILLTFRYLSKLQKWFWALTLSYSSQVGEKLFFFFFTYLYSVISCRSLEGWLCGAEMTIYPYGILLKMFCRFVFCKEHAFWLWFHENCISLKLYLLCFLF